MDIEKIVVKKIKACKTPGELMWVLDRITNAKADFAENYYLAISYGDFVGYMTDSGYDCCTIDLAITSRKIFSRALILDRDAKILICNVDYADADLRIFVLNDVEDFKNAKDFLLDELKSYEWDDLGDYNIFKIK